MKYLLGYRVKLDPIKFSKLKVLWYRLMASILGRPVHLSTYTSIEIHINGEPFIHGEIELCEVPGGMEVLYRTPFLVRDTDTVELKVQNLSKTAVVVELMMVEPEHRDLRYARAL